MGAYNGSISGTYCYPNDRKNSSHGFTKKWKALMPQIARERSDTSSDHSYEYIETQRSWPRIALAAFVLVVLVAGVVAGGIVMVKHRHHSQSSTLRAPEGG